MGIWQSLGNRVTDFINGDDGQEREAGDLKDRRMARGKAAFDRAGGGGAFGHPGLEYAGTLVNQGMQNHANAAGAINSAIGQEMESRVAQQREMRRMAHEQEMMRLRAEAARREREGDIIRSLLNG